MEVGDIVGAEIDRLDIQVEAQAVKANDALDNLATKLQRVSSSLSGINAGGLAVLSSGISKFAQASSQLSNLKTADFTRLSKNIDKIGKIDYSALKNASTSLWSFASALSSIDKISVSDNAEQLTSLAKGIAQLGYKSATNAIDNIPKLAVAMKGLMTTLSGAPRVSLNLIAMTNALAKLARTGASSGRAATSVGKALDSYTASTGRASKGTFNLASAIGKLYATYWILFRAFGKIGQAIDISSSLTEVQNVVDVTFGDMAYKVEELAKTSIEQFGMSELSLKQYASRFQAMGSAMGISGNAIKSANEYLNEQTKGYVGLSSSMADVSLNLTKLTADMASFYNVEQKDVAEDLEAVFTGMTRPLRQYGLDLTEATLKEWAMTHGLNSNIDAMTQAEKTMLRYQYVMANTGAAQGDFARTADTWANQVRILKQNFEQLASVIGGVSINVLKPFVKALNSSMSYAIAFAKTISESLGKIFGWTYEEGGGGIANDFEDAAGSAGDIADSTGKAADNIKKMQAGLRAFDELKTISMPDNNSGSGSGGSGGNGGSGAGASASGGNWKKTESLFYDSDLDNLYKLGDYIGSTLSNMMDSIDWDSIYEKARGFGKGFADFLNGLFADHNGITLFGSVGKTIAGALNTVIYASLSFGQTFDFKQFGRNIADGINNFFRTFDFGALAQTLNVWADGLIDLLGTTIKEIDKGAILDAFIDFFGNLELDTVAVVIGAVTIKKIGKVAWGFALSSILRPLAIKFAETFTMDLALAFGAGTFSGIAATIGFGLVGALAAWFGGQEMGKIIGKLIFPEDTEWYDNFSWFKEGGFFPTIKEELVYWWEDVSEWWNKTIVPGFDEFVGLFGDGQFSDAMSLWKDDIETNLIALANDEDKLMQPILNKFNEFKDLFDDGQFADAMRLWKEDIEKNLADTGEDVSDWYNNKVAPWFTKEKWNSFGNNMKNSISEKWNEFLSSWKTTGVYRWYEDNVKPWFSSDKWSFDGIKTGLINAWDGAIQAIKNVWNRFANNLNQHLKFTIDPIIIAGTTVFSGGTLNLGRIPTFANGGFPEDGWFRASKGEYFGKFDDGTSYIANNRQIENGIASEVGGAVRNANEEQNALLREQNALLREILQKDMGISYKEVFNAAKKGAYEYYMSTGDNALAF